MDKKVKAKWIKALKSGEYQQGKKALKSSSCNLFCCLGVLCDIYSQETGKGIWDGGHFHVDNDRGYGIPPTSVIEWAGLTDKNPDVHVGNIFQRIMNGYNKTSLAELNDNGATFKDIAEVIKTQL